MPNALKHATLSPGLGCRKSSEGLLQRGHEPRVDAGNGFEPDTVAG